MGGPLKRTIKPLRIKGKTPAARAEIKRFLTDYKTLVDRARRDVCFTILVWGQGVKRRSKLARKRRQIQATLRSLDHNAILSEDLDGVLIDDTFMSEKTKEFAQAKAAHMLIVLVEGAPGALAETHDFANDPDLAPKFFVLIPDEYKGGYSGRGAIRDLEAGYGGVYWYKRDAIDSCALLTTVVTRVEARRQIEYRKKAE